MSERLFKAPCMFAHQQTSSALPQNLLCTPSLPSCNLKTLRRHENSSMLSPGQRANSISRQAYIAFCSFQYPCVPAAALANCYQTGLFTAIFRRSCAFSVSRISTFEKGHERELKSKSKIHVAFIRQCISWQHSKRLGK